MKDIKDDKIQSKINTVLIPVRKKQKGFEFELTAHLKEAEKYILFNKLTSKLKEYNPDDVQLFKTNKSDTIFDAVICNSMFPMALKILNDKQIMVLKSEKMNLIDTIHDFNQGMLTLLSATESSSSCSLNCSSCATSCSTQN